MAACSEDMTIKVIPIDKSTDFFEFTEHEGPVLRIDLSVNDLLASSAGDGTIKIWNLNDKSCLKTISGFDKIKSYQATNVFGNIFSLLFIKLSKGKICSVFCLVTPSFEPKRGKYMAYNQKNKIIIVDTQNWDVKQTLTDEKVCVDDDKSEIESNIHNSTECFR